MPTKNPKNNKQRRLKGATQTTSFGVATSPEATVQPEAQKPKPAYRQQYQLQPMYPLREPREATSLGGTAAPEAAVQPGVHTAQKLYGQQYQPQPTDQPREVWQTTSFGRTTTPDVIAQPGVSTAQEQYLPYGQQHQPQPPKQLTGARETTSFGGATSPEATVQQVVSAAQKQNLPYRQQHQPQPSKYTEETSGEQSSMDSNVKGPEQQGRVLHWAQSCVTTLGGQWVMTLVRGQRPTNHSHSTEDVPRKQVKHVPESHKNKSCPECQQMKTCLKEKDEQIHRLEQQLTAEMRIQEGDLCIKRRCDFFDFFDHTIDKAVRNICGSEEKRKAREHLCTIFQMIYDHLMVKTYSSLQRKLGVYLKMDNEEADEDGGESAMEEYTMNQMNRAYARLLLASGIARRCPSDGKEIWQLLDQKGMASGSKIPREQLQHCVDEAVQVAWGMITMIPPQIATCEPKNHFDDNLHESLGDTQHPPEEGNYKLVYRRPILFASCTNKLVDTGRVRIVQSEDAKVKGDSVLKRDPGSNSSGTKVLRKGSKLTVENVMRELKDVIDWYSLGVELKLPKEVLEKQDFDKGGSDMIHEWLKMEGSTWQSLATALADAGETDSADKVKEYCKSLAPNQEPVSKSLQAQHPTDTADHTQLSRASGVWTSGGEPTGQ